MSVLHISEMISPFYAVNAIATLFVQILAFVSISEDIAFKPQSRLLPENAWHNVNCFDSYFPNLL